jgi:hypothetical protein
MTLGQLAKTNPSAKVRLVFCSPDGKTGMLNTTAGKAAQPNLSMRYFPEEGETAASLGWGKPFWYSEEIVRVYIL